MDRTPDASQGQAQTPGPANAEAAAEWVAIDAVHAWKDNPRKNGKAIGEVAKSIRRFGFGAPILARRNGEIIAGHTRWEAAKKLGLDRVPVRFLDLDPAEAHLLALADNKLGEVADWDDERLAAIVNLMQSEGVDVTTGTGFDDEAIDKIVASLDTEGAEAEPELDASLGYKLVVDCKDERDQAMLLERLEADGYSCKPLIS